MEKHKDLVDEIVRLSTEQGILLISLNENRTRENALKCLKNLYETLFLMEKCPFIEKEVIDTQNKNIIGVCEIVAKLN